MTREEAKEILQGSRITSFRPNGTARAKEALNMAIETLSAEARPTGEWIFNTNTSNGKSWNVCSECGESMFHPANFCPNCGADMRGGKDDER